MASIVAASAQDQSCYCGSSLDELISAIDRPQAINFRSLVSCFRYGERGTHGIHPYPAKLLPQIPHVLISNPELCPPDAVIADPFCGSGTVLLEAAMAGRRCWGADCNPLACLISRVKTRRLNPARLECARERLEARIERTPDTTAPDVVNISYWYYPRIVRELARIAAAVKQTRRTEYREFFQVALSVTARRLSLADPRVPVPVRTRATKYPRDHWLHKKSRERLRFLKRVDVPTTFMDVVRANIKRSRVLWDQYPSLGHADVLSSDARQLTLVTGCPFPGNSVDLVITSPPYGTAQKYIRAASLSLGWLELCKSDELVGLKRTSIGREHFRRGEVFEPATLDDAEVDQLLVQISRKSPLRATAMATYLLEMSSALREMVRIVKPGGYVALIVGDNTVVGSHFPTTGFIRRTCDRLGLEHRAEFIDRIRSRGLLTSRHRTAALITQEHLILQRKPA